MIIPLHVIMVSIRSDNICKVPQILPSVNAFSQCPLLYLKKNLLSINIKGLSPSETHFADS